MQLTSLLIERERYMRMLRGWHGKNVIKVLTGVRRAGKSTLLQMFAEELRQKLHVSNEQIQFLNFEDLDTLALGDIFQIHTHIKEKLISDKPNYIFLDEVQNVKDFQRLVDSLFIKSNCDVYITGSNAHLLSGELATLLTGRYIEIEVLPLSFSEYVQFLSETSHLTNYQQVGIANPKNLAKMQSFSGGAIPLLSTENRALLDFAYLGGLPEFHRLCFTEGVKPDSFIKSVLNTIIEKDIFSRNGIKNKEVFNKVIDFVFDSIGSPVSPNSISKALNTELKQVGFESVLNYLTRLSDAMLLYAVPRYEIKGKGLLKTLNKYYLSDAGFRRVRLGKTPEKDMGHLLENAIYLELRRRNAKVYVGKFRDKEIDFVTIDHAGYTSYYQVAFTAQTPDTLERELAPLRAVRDSNPKYLITMDYDFNPVYDGIRKLNAADWLLEKHDS